MRDDDRQPDPVVLFEVANGVAIARLNRPSARNAINGEVTKTLAAIVVQVESDPAIRVAILASTSPTAFSAGADLGEIAAGRGRSLTTEDGGLGGFVRAKRRKPWIAAVTGFAMGGGMELALAADMIVAGEGAIFGLPESLRGLAAGAGGMFRLPRLIPRPVAIEMLTTGMRLDARRAFELGLVNAVVPDGGLLDAAVALAARVVASAPLAVMESLALARIAQDHDETRLWELSAEVSARITATDDAGEGARAFVEKRSPVWAGR